MPAWSKTATTRSGSPASRSRSAASPNMCETIPSDGQARRLSSSRSSSRANGNSIRSLPNWHCTMTSMIPTSVRMVLLTAGTDPVLESPDAIGLDLHQVAWLDPAPELVAASAVVGAYAEDLTRIDRLVTRGPGDDLREGELPAVRRALGPDLVVDPGAHVDAELVADLVEGDRAGAERVGEVLALAGPHPHGHLFELGVAGAEVVEYRDRADRVPRLGERQVLAAGADDDRDLGLVVEAARVGRPGHRGAGALHGQVVALVADRIFGEHIRHVHAGP